MNRQVIDFFSMVSLKDPEKLKHTISCKNELQLLLRDRASIDLLMKLAAGKKDDGIVNLLIEITRERIRSSKSIDFEEYSYIKAASVILRELDRPEFDSIEGMLIIHSMINNIDKE